MLAEYTIDLTMYLAAAVGFGLLALVQKWKQTHAEEER